jgi:tol-pal system protein YbgF
MPLPPSFAIRSARRNLLLGLGASLILGACAPVPPARRGNTEAEDAELLRLAREAQLELQTQSSRLAELEGQVRDLSEMIAWNAAQTAAHARALDSLRRPAAVAGTARTAGAAAPSAPATHGRVSPDEATAYRLALDKHFARQYPAAIAAFRDLLARHPRGAYADNAAYWIGEGQYAQGDFTAALASFQGVLQHAGSGKTDDAWLKIGYCHLRLGDREKAGAAFRKLVSSYPASEYVERARGELEKLGGF